MDCGRVVAPVPASVSPAALTVAVTTRGAVRGAGGGAGTTGDGGGAATGAAGAGAGAGWGAGAGAAVASGVGTCSDSGASTAAEAVSISAAGASASAGWPSDSGGLSTILIRLRAARSAFGFGADGSRAGGAERRLPDDERSWEPASSRSGSPGRSRGRGRTRRVFTSTPIPCRRKRTSFAGLPIILASSATVNFAAIVFTSRGSPSPARLPRARSPSRPWRPRRRLRRLPRTRRSRWALGLVGLRRPRPRCGSRLRLPRALLGRRRLERPERVEGVRAVVLVGERPRRGARCLLVVSAVGLEDVADGRRSPRPRTPRAAAGSRSRHLGERRRRGAARRGASAGAPAATSALTACSLLMLDLRADRAPRRAGRSVRACRWRARAGLPRRCTRASASSPSPPVRPTSGLLLVVASAETRVILAGERAFCAYVMRSSENWMMSIRSPRSSRMIAWTRAPRMPTQAPTGSTSRSREETATLARSPGWRTQPRMTTVPS